MNAIFIFCKCILQVRVVNGVPPTGDYPFAKYNKVRSMYTAEARNSERDRERYCCHASCVIGYLTMLGFAAMPLKS